MINKYAAAQRLNSALMRNALRKQAAIDWSNVGATVGGGALTSGAVMGVHALINKLLGRKGSWLEYLASGVPAAFAGGYVGNRLLAGHRQAVGDAGVAGYNEAYRLAGTPGQLLIDGNRIAEQLKYTGEHRQEIIAARMAQTGEDKNAATRWYEEDLRGTLRQQMLGIQSGLKNVEASTRTRNDLFNATGLPDYLRNDHVGKENIKEYNKKQDKQIAADNAVAAKRLAEHYSGGTELSPRSEYEYLYGKSPAEAKKIPENNY